MEKHAHLYWITKSKYAKNKKYKKKYSVVVKIPPKTS